MKMYWLYPCILLSAPKYFFFTIKMLCILQTLKMKSNNHDGYNGLNIHFEIILKKEGCTGALMTRTPLVDLIVVDLHGSIKPSSLLIN